MESDDAEGDTRKFVTAPFTPAQVEALNAWQAAGYVHPFTCGNDTHDSHVNLVATEAGWVCPDADCAYTQDWAHAFMASGTLPPNPLAKFFERDGDS